MDKPIHVKKRLYFKCEFESENVSPRTPKDNSVKKNDMKEEEKPKEKTSPEPLKPQA